MAAKLGGASLPQYQHFYLVYDVELLVCLSILSLLAKSLFFTHVCPRVNAAFVPDAPTFDKDVVRLSREIMRGRSADEQRGTVGDIMLTFLPPEALDLSR